MVRTALVCAVALACGGCGGLAAQRDAPAQAAVEQCAKPEPTAVEIKVFGPTTNTVLVHGPEAIQWYPPRALDAGKFGSATLNCRVVGGKPEICTVVKEDGDYGFGAIALKLAKRYQPPLGSDGESIKLDYQFIILAIGYRQFYVTDVIRQPCPPPNPPLSDAALN